MSEAQFPASRTLIPSVIKQCRAQNPALREALSHQKVLNQLARAAGFSDYGSWSRRLPESSALDSFVHVTANQIILHAPSGPRITWPLTPGELPPIHRPGVVEHLGPRRPGDVARLGDILLPYTLREMADNEWFVENCFGVPVGFYNYPASLTATDFFVRFRRSPYKILKAPVHQPDSDTRTISPVLQWESVTYDCEAAAPLRRLMAYETLDFNGQPDMGFRWRFLPYGAERISADQWAFFNRSYKGLGLPRRQWTVYEDHPMVFQVADSALQRICIHGDLKDRIYLYNDGSVPTQSKANMDAYMQRLLKLCHLQVTAV